ncbi:MAG TPA: hypothetical protein DEB31_00435 [Clostridiales bacterium]|nr:hypothetical protein [Clostridiales bacterium]
MNTQPHKSTTGMNANDWVALLYIITIVLGWIPGAYYVAWVLPLIFYLTEKQSDFVRYYAIQAVAAYVINAIVRIIIDIIVTAVSISLAFSTATFNPFGTIMGSGGIVAASAIAVIVTLIIMIFCLIALSNAYRYRSYDIPMVSRLAQKFVRMGHR